MIIFHGTNIIASRKALTDKKEQVRQKGMELVELNGKNLELSLLKQALESGSLFGGKRLVVIEGLFSLVKSKKKEEIIDYLKNYKEDGLVCWEGKKIDGRILRSFSGAKITDFKLSPVIFKFLDAWGPGNIKFLLSCFHELVETDPVELVFYMLARRNRDLIVAKNLGKEGLGRMAPWQRDRLLRQAGAFSLDQLILLHERLLKIDWEQKTGRSVLPLASNIDFLILADLS